MKKQTFWKNTGYKPGKGLIGDHKTRYLIIGGGVTGLFVAHFLMKKRIRNITIVERGFIGSGSTGQSAGMLTAQLETAPIDILAKIHGHRAASNYARALKQAQREVRRLIKDGKLVCEYKNHSLTFFRNELSKGEYLEKSISVNPLKFIQGMAQYLRGRGVMIYENTPILRVKDGVAITPQGTIRFGHVTYALGTSLKHRSLTNYITTICVTRPLSIKKIRGLRRAGKSMFFDDERQSYHYGKITSDRRLLIGYGDVHKPSKGAEAQLHSPHLRNIRRYALRTLATNIRIHRAWSAAYSVSKKPLPYVSLEKGVVGGAGTQIASIAIASYFASTVLRQKHPLGSLFRK